MKERIDFFSKIVICLAGLLILGYIFLKHLLLILLPFLISWTIAFAVRPPAHYLSARLHVPERVLRLILAVGLIALGLLAVFFFVRELLVQAWRILTSLGEQKEIFTVFERIMNPESTLARFLPDGISDGIAHTLEEAVASLTSSFAAFAARAVSAVPSAVLFIVVTLIASIFFSLDLERVNGFLRSKLPERMFNAVVRFKNEILGIGAKYAKGYATVMLITFATVFIGLLLLGVEYAFLISVIISVLDILPVIGIGTVLVPWSVFQLAFGSRALGIGLLILFLIAEFIRQIAEPKIIGKNLGLHPIVSLALLYGSYSLFGIVGILLIPCTAVVINALLNKDDPAEVKKRRVGKGDKA